MARVIQEQLKKPLAGELLFGLVTPERPVEQLAYVRVLLAEIGQDRSRADFFAHCGKPCPQDSGVDWVELAAATFEMGVPREQLKFLKSEGCYSGSIDGVFGRGSSRALNQYRRKAQLPPPVGQGIDLTLAQAIVAEVDERLQAVSVTGGSP